MNEMTIIHVMTRCVETNRQFTHIRMSRNSPTGGQFGGKWEAGGHFVGKWDTA